VDWLLLRGSDSGLAREHAPGSPPQIIDFAGIDLRQLCGAGAVLHGDREQLIGFDPFEHPVAPQLGGGDPSALTQCARTGADLRYDEINLNVGCPSDRVQEGRFGASLMAEPHHVADCVATILRRHHEGAGGGAGDRNDVLRRK
jgi:Dihydrouridine synthase (Dus)